MRPLRSSMRSSFNGRLWSCCEGRLYEQEIETDDHQETETETWYEIIFTRIIEYQKALGSTSLNNAYDWEDDIVISSTSLLDWGEISDIVEDADGIVSTFTVTTTDNVASFTFSISRAAVGEAISANKMKIDFELMSFAWSQSDTYVALLSDIETKRKIEVEYDDDSSEDATGRSSGSSTKKTEDVLINFEDALDATGIVPFWEYTWAETAVAIDNTTATNTTIQVIGTSPGGSESENSGTTSIESIAFSIVGSAAHQAEDIYWDPEAGINYRSASNDGSAASQLGLSVIFLLAVSSAALCAMI